MTTSLTMIKIAVCVKHVPDGRLRIDAVSRRIDRTGSGEINHFDTNAVEEALRIKEGSDAEVVVVSMGPEGAVDSLRTALGLGADRAVLVSDPGAVGSDLVATSKVLTKALEREKPDLVLFGQQASDGVGALLWGAVAEGLHLPVVSQVTKLTIHDGMVRLTRQTEFGDDIVETSLPAIVAVNDAINEPRYASLKGMMGAKKKPLDILSLADLGLSTTDAGVAGSKTEVLGVTEPPPRSNVLKIEDDGNAAEVIVNYLVDRQLA